MCSHLVKNSHLIKWPNLTLTVACPPQLHLTYPIYLSIYPLISNEGQGSGVARWLEDSNLWAIHESLGCLMKVKEKPKENPKLNSHTELLQLNKCMFCSLYQNVTFMTCLKLFCDYSNGLWVKKKSPSALKQTACMSSQQSCSCVANVSPWPSFVTDTWSESLLGSLWTPRLAYTPWSE